MSEVRVDPLTGLRTLVGAEHAPTHDDLYTSLPDGHVEERLTGGPATWRERVRARGAACALVRAESIEAATLFALDFVPAAIARERERFSAYAVRTMGGNLLGDLVQEEVRRRARLVAYDDEAVLIAPYASRHERQLLLAPRTPAPRWEAADRPGDALLSQTLERLGGGFEAWVRTAPSGAEHYCWRIDILPAIPADDPLARGAGLPTCALAPEAWAAQLRA